MKLTKSQQKQLTEAIQISLRVFYVGRLLLGDLRTRQKLQKKFLAEDLKRAEKLKKARMKEKLKLEKARFRHRRQKIRRQSSKKKRFAPAGILW